MAKCAMHQPATLTKQQLRVRRHRLFVGLTFFVVLGFIGLWMNLSADARVAPEQLENVLGLTLPSSSSDVRLNVGGFVDTQIEARFEMAKRDMPMFIAENGLELDDSLRQLQDEDSRFGWWQPNGLLRAQSFGLIGPGKPVRQATTSTGFYLNVLIGQRDVQGDQLLVYLRAADD
jgi:hypothetical protein